MNANIKPDTAYISMCVNSKWMTAKDSELISAATKKFVLGNNVPKMIRRKMSSSKIGAKNTIEKKTKGTELASSMKSCVFSEPGSIPKNLISILAARAWPYKTIMNPKTPQATDLSVLEACPFKGRIKLLSFRMISKVMIVAVPIPMKVHQPLASNIGFSRL